MTKPSHPELDGQHPETLYTFKLKRPGQTLRERLTWGAVGLSIGLSVAAGYFFLNPSERVWSWPAERANTATVEDPFRRGAEQAMAAAELTQTAEFQEEWAKVAMLWQQAIAHMQSVPKGNPQAELAQQKVKEYARNLQYAQSNVASRATQNPTDQVYWTVGSDRDLVMAIQGPPDQSIEQHSTCQQTLRYGNSIVEINNGYVDQYDNPDGTLNVLAEGPVVFSTKATPGTWTLGSTEADIVQLQGTPTREEQYTSDRFKTLYYGKSSVFLENGQAIGYLNTDDNLNVSVQLPALPPGQAAPEFWSIGSSRADVLRAEKHAPIAISRNDTNCEEVFNFEEGEVTFRQGLVTGFRDRGAALKVR
jgi:hypothetical protein